MPKTRKRLLRFLAAAAVILVLIVLAVVLFSRDRAHAAFSHKPHADAGIPCEMCHASVRDQSFAGRPTTQACRMCHADDRESPASGEPRVNLPSDVFFSHRRHVAVAMIDCSVCHADVGTSTVVPRNPPITPTMNFCLSCHETAGASQDCISCHR